MRAAVVVFAVAHARGVRARFVIERYEATLAQLYQFGYLHMADTLCYWRRELAQLEAIMGTASGVPPACVF